MDRESSSHSLFLSSPRVTQGSHQFKITGYSLCKGIGIGKYIASDTFMVGGYTWAVYFYPDGKGVEDNSSYVSLFIALVSEGTDVRALFELTFFDQSGKDRHKIHTHFGRTPEIGPYTLKYRGSMWGYKRFFKRTLLETSDYLKDDCLSVHCRVGVVKSHTEGPKIYSIPTPPSDIGQHFGQFLESGKGTDDISMDNVPVASASTVQSQILVTVKANYRNDFVRFQLPASSGIHELYRQVSQRLELTEGTYDLSYRDDDNDLILLACDEDLQFYISSSTKQGNYTLLVSIKSKCASPMLFP